jgi:hypothetical protein
MNRIRSRVPTLRLLLLAFVGVASPTAEYDYKPGEVLVINAGESPDKKFCLVSEDPDTKGGFIVFGSVRNENANFSQVTKHRLRASGPLRIETSK